jgi:hypothetical protein
MWAGPERSDAAVPEGDGDVFMDDPESDGDDAVSDSDGDVFMEDPETDGDEVDMAGQAGRSEAAGAAIEPDAARAPAGAVSADAGDACVSDAESFLNFNEEVEDPEDPHSEAGEAFEPDTVVAGIDRIAPIPAEPAEACESDAESFMEALDVNDSDEEPDDDVGLVAEPDATHALELDSVRS